MARCFEACKGYEEVVQLPERSTQNAAGYDFFAAEDVILPSIFESLWRLLKKEPMVPTIVPTHVKAKMRANEVLMLFNRSSNPKRGLILANGTGVVDADYYGNQDNDGDIGFPFFNILPWPISIERGQKIGQGVFQTYLKVDEDKSTGAKRTGGFGSTDTPTVTA